MAKHIIPVSIEAKDHPELVQVTQAINTLLQKVGPQELIRFAQAVYKKPSLIKTALKFI